MASGCHISTIHAQCQTLITVGAPIKALEMLSFLNRNKALYVIEDFLPLSRGNDNDYSYRLLRQLWHVYGLVIKSLCRNIFGSVQREKGLLHPSWICICEEISIFRA